MTFFLAEDVILLLAFAFAADFDVDFDSEEDAFFAAAVVLLADDTAFFVELTLDAVLLDGGQSARDSPNSAPYYSARRRFVLARSVFYAVF